MSVRCSNKREGDGDHAQIKEKKMEIMEKSVWSVIDGGFGERDYL